MKFMLTGLILLAALPILSQPANPPSPVPLGGLEILLGLGALFGIKKILAGRRFRK